MRARPRACRTFEPIDRASGGLIDWPGGHAPYAYGATVPPLPRRRDTGRSRCAAGRRDRRAPAVLRRRRVQNGVRRIAGRSLEATSKRESREQRRARRATPLPRQAADASRLRRRRAAVRPRTAASTTRPSNPHGFPALMSLAAGRRRAAAGRGQVPRLARGFAGGELVFDQVELVRQVALQSDLYAVPTDGGERSAADARRARRRSRLSRRTAGRSSARCRRPTAAAWRR